MILLRNSETQKGSPPLRVGLPVTILSCSYIADIFQRSEAEVWQVLCQGLTNATRGPTLQGKQTAEQIYGSLKHKVCKHSGKGPLSNTKTTHELLEIRRQMVNKLLLLSSHSPKTYTPFPHRTPWEIHAHIG